MILHKAILPIIVAFSICNAVTIEDSLRKVYDTNNIVTVSGKINNIEVVKHDNQSVIVFLLNQNNTTLVQLAPLWYLNELNINIQVNDRIEVTGSKVNFMEKEQIVAAKMKWNNKVYHLRDEKGNPLWYSTTP